MIAFGHGQSIIFALCSLPKRGTYSSCGCGIPNQVFRACVWWFVRSFVRLCLYGVASIPPCLSRSNLAISFFFSLFSFIHGNTTDLPRRLVVLVWHTRYMYTIPQSYSSPLAGFTVDAEPCCWPDSTHRSPVHSAPVSGAPPPPHPPTVQKLSVNERYMFASVIRDGYLAHMTITSLPAAYEVTVTLNVNACIGVGGV